MAILHLTQDNFDQVIADNSIVFVDFWAQWCAPCLAFGEVFEKSANRNSDITFAKVNTEEQPELANDFNVRSIPLLIVLKDQIVIYSEAGALPETALQGLIDQARALDMTEVKAKIAKMRDEEGKGGV